MGAPGVRGAGRPAPSGAQFGQRREPGDRADREPGGWGDPRLIRRRRRDGGEPLVRHERARAAVAEYVGDLGGGQVPVDRHHVQAGLHRGEEQREDRGAVGQHPGHAVAWAQPERLQAPADLVGPGGQFGVADDRAVRLDHRRAVRVLRCDGPQADVSHEAQSRTCSKMGQAMNCNTFYNERVTDTPLTGADGDRVRLHAVARAGARPVHDRAQGAARPRGARRGRHGALAAVRV